MIYNVVNTFINRSVIYLYPGHDILVILLYKLFHFYKYSLVSDDSINKILFTY